MTDRKVIRIIDDIKTGQTTKVKGGGRAKKSPKYVEPLFELKILPMTLNLPMICKPQEDLKKKTMDTTNSEKNSFSTKKRAPSFSDLSGGYFSKAGSEFMHRYRLWTSNDYDHFYVRFNHYESYTELCKIVTTIIYLSRSTR